MPEGYLRIQVNSANDAYPIEDAMIRIYKDEAQSIVFETFLISDESGLTPYVSLVAPPVSLSLDENIACFENIVIPLDFSISCVSKNVSFLSTLPICLIVPIVYKIASASVVLPESTCASIPYIIFSIIVLPSP